MRKPNAILHMIKYNFAYTFLAIIVSFLFMSGEYFENNVTVDSLIVFCLYGGYLAFSISLIFSTILGFVQGIFLWFLTRRLSLPINDDEFSQTRNRPFGMIGVLALVVMIAIMLTPRNEPLALFFLLFIIGLGAICIYFYNAS